MGSKINEKLGLKPQTRKRQATHGTQIAARVPCPVCASRHVMRTQSSNGRRLGELWCACGAFFNAPTERQIA